MSEVTVEDVAEALTTTWETAKRQYAQHLASDCRTCSTIGRVRCSWAWHLRCLAGYGTAGWEPRPDGSWSYP